MWIYIKLMVNIRSIICYHALDSLKFYYFLLFNIQDIYNSIMLAMNLLFIILVTGNLYLACICNRFCRFNTYLQWCHQVLPRVGVRLKRKYIYARERSDRARASVASEGAGGCGKGCPPSLGVYHFIWNMCDLAHNLESIFNICLKTFCIEYWVLNVIWKSAICIAWREKISMARGVGIFYVHDFWHPFHIFIYPYNGFVHIRPY